MPRKLLACSALLTVIGGAAFAQSVIAPSAAAPPGPGVTWDGTYHGVGPQSPVPAAGANNNNNVQAAPLPGPTARPTPGSFVVRLGGRMNVETGAGWAH